MLVNRTQPPKVPITVILRLQEQWSPTRGVRESQSLRVIGGQGADIRRLLLRRRCTAAALTADRGWWTVLRSTIRPRFNPKSSSVLTASFFRRREGLAKRFPAATVSPKRAADWPIADLATMAFFTYSTLCWRSLLYTQKRPVADASLPSF